MAKRKGSSAPSCSRARKKADRDAREVENAQRLDKLPKEVWEKIFDELSENDLFPLALSCKYFRQKQKELVERTTRQSGSDSDDSRRALKTNLQRKLEKGTPASAEYIQFARQEPGSIRYGLRTKKNPVITNLAAYHGHLSLLQMILYKEIEPEIGKSAGQSSFPTLIFFVSASDLFLAFSSSQRSEANWRP